MRRPYLAPLLLLIVASPSVGSDVLPTADGYRGIWYQIRSGGEIKYSGGFATYPQQIRPFAIYRKEVNKTFFCYGGTDEKNSTLLHMVSYFDHATGTVPRPRILLDKKTTDAHDNPAMAIDDRGYIWIFSNTHGPEKRSIISRSSEPYAIDKFDRVATTSFSYGMPWFIPGSGFLFINNRYSDGRAIASQTSTDGYAWSEPALIAQMKVGHYEISLARGKGVMLAFNYHPHGLDTRTNLYYVQTTDFGKTWRTIDGAALKTPLKDVLNPALVHDYESEKKLVYLKDIQFDARGNPIILYLTSGGHLPGDASGTRQWTIAHWSDHEWRLKPAFTSDHNYDFGQLSIEEGGTWRIIAPTDPGPQPGMTGGDVVMWTSRDEGGTWTKLKTLTAGLSEFNHTYVRQPIDARDDFYAFWADGDPRQRSESRLYFTNKQGDAVWQLPTHMTAETAKPERLNPSPDLKR